MQRVLLVEDNDLNRDMLKRRLEKRGYVVEVALDGVQGVSSAQQWQPDIILLDMSLPLMDGWAAADCMKCDASTRHIPIIGLSSHAMAGDRERALAVGCTDYDTKPVDLERLIGKITRCLTVPSAVGQE